MPNPIKKKTIKDGWKIIDDSGAFRIRESDSGYGWKHTQYECPICKTWHWKTAKFIHITTKAKKEALDKTSNPDMETPHLDFYLENTMIQEVRVWNLEKLKRITH